MPIPISRKEYTKVEAEIAEHKKESAKVAREIAEAREKGDLSENAEYHAAREHKAMIDAKIAQLQSRLAESEIIDTKNIDTEHAGFGTKVTLYNTDEQTDEVYIIVDEGNADLRAGKISVTSPIATALNGHVVGDKIEVTIPAGILRFEIKKIEAAD